MFSVLLALSAIFSHISAPKRLLLVKTIYKITLLVYLHRLQAAGIKFFIFKCQQCPRYGAQNILGGSMAADVISGISKLPTKEVEFVDSNCIFNPSLRL